MGKDGKITKEAAGYIICNCLLKIIDLFVSTFLVAYLLKISNGNMFNVALYYIVNYIALGVFYSLFSYFLHKGNKVVFYRCGILIKCIFLILIALLKENIVNYIIPLALFYGLSSGIYWSSYNVMMNEAISSKSIQKFYGIYNIWGYIISIVAPLVLGSIIDSGSFVKTAIYAFIVCLLLFATTFLLVSRKEEGDKLDFKGLIKDIKNTNQSKAFLECYLMIFFNGLRQSTSTIITIMIVLTFSSNVSLGSLSSIMAIVSILITFLFMKKYDSSKSRIVFGCMILVLIGVGGIFLDINKPTIVLFNVLYTMSMIVPDNLNSQKRMGIIRVTRKLKYALEHNILAEVFLNIGRVISYVVLLVASFSNSLNVYKVLLAINLVCICLYCLIVYKVERKYTSIIFKNDVMEHLREVEDDCSGYYHYKGELRKEYYNKELIKENV